MEAEFSILFFLTDSVRFYGTVICIGVREDILLGWRKQFAL